MNDNPNDNAPDPEEIEVSTIGQPNEVGTVHTFKGKILRPYSFADRCLKNRMVQDEMSGIEFAAIFLWILSLNPREVPTIRGEEKIAQAFERSAEWAQAEGFHSSPEVRSEAMTVVQEITRLEEQANNWEVAPERRGNLPIPPTPAPGNA